MATFRAKQIDVKALRRVDGQWEVDLASGTDLDAGTRLTLRNDQFLVVFEPGDDEARTLAIAAQQDDVEQAKKVLVAPPGHPSTWPAPPEIDNGRRPIKGKRYG